MSVETPGTVSRNPREKNVRPIVVSLGGFFSPPTEMSYTTPQVTTSCPKKKALTKEKKLCYDLRNFQNGKSICMAGQRNLWDFLRS